MSHSYCQFEKLVINCAKEQYVHDVEKEDVDVASLSIPVLHTIVWSWEAIE